MAQIDCRHFTGYKPCGKCETCDSNCSSYSPVDKHILIIHLEALGAVLRSTSLLAAIKRKYPNSHISWVTKAPAQHLLRGLAEIDRVFTLLPEDVMELSAVHFDLALVIDKSLLAAGILQHLSVNEVRGFRSQGSAIVPANREAQELWELGLSNAKKFFKNQKSEQHLVHEALALGPYRKDEYAIQLTEIEQQAVKQRRKSWGGSLVIGINTGCSLALPYKKLSVEGHRQLIEQVMAHPQFEHASLVLLGGPEDSERNQQIARELPVFSSPTTSGLRDGLVSVAACDLVFTGDSLGLHMAVGLKKWVVAWFGPTCAQEIELYGRGRKIHTSAPCSPCWKRVCHAPKMCYDQVDFTAVIHALVEGAEWLTSSSKPPFREISSSPSPS